MQKFAMASALAAATPAWAQSPETPGATACAIHIRAVDDQGAALNARGEVVSGSGSAVTAIESGLCVSLRGAGDVVRILVTADGYQPHVTDPLTLTPESAHALIVTLMRPFEERVTVATRADANSTAVTSASAGAASGTELRARPLARAGDILEVVPGVAITQHSSGGHAPVILLRGYNLDHGTDFATEFEGVPLNLPSHAHAQGYTDTSFLIEDVIGRVEYQKGPYSAQIGNFGTAGAARIELADRIEHPYVRLELGTYGFRRTASAASFGAGAHRVLVAAEASHDDGPSEVPDDFGRVKALGKYTAETASTRVSFTYAGYGASWRATDGYPRRALDRGYISRFGTLDPTDGGKTATHIITSSVQRTGRQHVLTAGAYARRYELDLFSNLTFWARSAAGDQIGQTDRRTIVGGQLSYSRSMLAIGPVGVQWSAGMQIRHDAARVALFNTVGRQAVAKVTMNGEILEATASDARIAESTLAPHTQVQMSVRRWFLVTAGTRFDAVRMRVLPLAQLSGRSAWAALASPKAALALGPWQGTTVYASAGYGFHSNHALGVLNGGQQQLTTGSRTAEGQGAPPLVRTRGVEVGLRLERTRLRTSMALWRIDSDSELVYSADEGVTLPERAGRRSGVEWLNAVRVLTWLSADVDLAWSTARYRSDPIGEGRQIPDAASVVVGAGVTATPRRTTIGVRVRHVGKRPLVPSGEAVLEPSTVLNTRAEVRLSRRLGLSLDGFNLLNARYEDTAFYYATRLREPGTGSLEPAAVPDYVTHPGQPRAVRVGLRVWF